MLSTRRELGPKGGALTDEYYKLSTEERKRYGLAAAMDPDVLADELLAAIKAAKGDDEVLYLVSEEMAKRGKNDTSLARCAADARASGAVVSALLAAAGETSVGRRAFQECSGLTSVSIPESVTSIGEAAFRECTSLTSVSIPESVTFIGNRAFEGCSGLTSVSIPESVRSIGEDAFPRTTNVTRIERR